MAVIVDETAGLKGRSVLVDALVRELLGPDPQGDAIDCGGPLIFDSWAAAHAPHVQASTDDEILTGDRPLKRYGVGVLYPWATALDADVAVELSDGDDSDDEDTAALAVNDPDEFDAPHLTRSPVRGETDIDDAAGLSSANAYRPSSMGLSLEVELSAGSHLELVLTGGVYSAREVRYQAKSGPRGFEWWVRSHVEIIARFDGATLVATSGRVTPESVVSNLPPQLVVVLSAVSRPSTPGRSLITVSAVNKTLPGGALDGLALFQVALRVNVRGGRIHPYRTTQASARDPEQASLDLLYRDVPSFAIGHGCAATWPERHALQPVDSVIGEALPQYEAPSVTPDITLGAEGGLLEVPMALLTSLDPDGAGFARMGQVVSEYERWINEAQAPRVSGLDAGHQDTALRHLDDCRIAHARMVEGLEALRSDRQVRRAFELANAAMERQQGRATAPLREATLNRDTGAVSYPPVVPEPTSGKWRPFQITFVLAALASTASGTHRERDAVELIFFPTGGGKTEAYLALSAFSIFLRRLRDPGDSGVDVLMRYTLRLLTAQQFERAAALICAMDLFRRAEPEELGDVPISIGVWLGRSTTPNTKAEAREKLQGLDKDGTDAENPFILLRCPWCAAEMGPVGSLRSRGRRRGDWVVVGYEQRESSVEFACPDRSCAFAVGLPVTVTDEDLYAIRPDLVIGTVDKFASLAFRPEARALFGLDDHGERCASPPNLVIQDELHLISGPLGSMVGMYEPVIEELCTDRRDGGQRKPKIVASTATIRRYQHQLRDLYGRGKSFLFPPNGLDAGDSFFARYARDSAGRLAPGRTYIGVHAPGLGSVQTAQVRTWAALLQAPMTLAVEDRDPWWTLLAFFNSLRELGTTLSLLQSDIRDYLKVLRRRGGPGGAATRQPWNILELTGRLRSDEVPKALRSLSRPYDATQPSAVDVCLASNIVEVGVDVTRLTLMVVMGQPKTTAQYIQATGRVGRDWRRHPGLVVTVYGPSKARDRSHFERFQTYHERLYEQVEPTSVTPFAAPVLDRALHAVIVAYVRQLGDLKATPNLIPEDLLMAAADLMRKRVETVDPGERERVESVLNSRIDQWTRREPLRWLGVADGRYPLLRFAGEYADDLTKRTVWPVPISMRDVDAECRAQVTRAYGE